MPLWTMRSLLRTYCIHAHVRVLTEEQESAIKYHSCAAGTLQRQSILPDGSMYSRVDVLYSLLYIYSTGPEGGEGLYLDVQYNPFRLVVVLFLACRLDGEKLEGSVRKFPCAQHTLTKLGRGHIFTATGPPGFMLTPSHTPYSRVNAPNVINLSR